MQRFTEPRVWQRAHSFVLELYRLTEAFPARERFGVVAQMRRAAVSVATNIAEGSKRRGRPDYARFLNIAEGSLAETEYLLILSRDLGYLPPEVSGPLLADASQISRMLHALRTRVEEAERLEKSLDS